MSANVIPIERVLRARALRDALPEGLREAFSAADAQHVPSSDPAPSTDHTDLVFGTSGLLAQSFPGYSPRDGQVALSRAIDEVIAAGFAGDHEHSRLVGEAPCGVGKTLSYLAPAILHAVPRGQRVLVVTENNALTEQLVGKDLPTLQRVLAPVLPRELTFAALVGRGNFLCLDKVQGAEPDEELALDPFASGVSDRTLADLARIDAWSSTTETGNRNELTVSDAAWSMRSTSSEDCKRDGCAHHRECFAALAKQRAEGADVIVTNYALFFLAMKMRAMNEGKDTILPASAVVILDEAHAAPDKARDALGMEQSPGAYRKLTRWLRKQGEPTVHALAAEIGSLSDAFFADAATGVRDPAGGKTALTAGWASNGEALVAATVRAMNLAAATVKRLAGFDLEDTEKRARADARNAGRRAQRLARGAWDAALLSGSPDHLFWVEVEQRQGRGGRSGQSFTRTRIRSADLDIGAALRTHLWGHRETRALIAVSATLTTGPGLGGWEFARRELGFPDVTRTLAVPSPFDFARQALLVMPQGLPDPQGARTGADSEGTYERAAASRLLDTIRAADGRTLALFTSRKGLEIARQELASARLPFTVLVQDGATPRQELMRRFMADTHSVLLGLQSFGTGIDPAGEACSAVFIDKLPFPIAGDPLAQGLIERAGERWFAQEFYPRMMLTLRQWVGRAIRTKTDTAAVVLCDPRLKTKGYGPGVVRGLGLPTQTTDIASIRPFLAGEPFAGQQRGLW